MSELIEVGKTISAATAEKLRVARDAIDALLNMVEAETPDAEGDTLAEAVSKTEDGKQFGVGDYAYVPDAQSPSTWKLRLTATPGGAPDAVHTGAAAAALGPNPPHGQAVQIPAADLLAVKAKVRAAWTKAHPDQAADMPASIKEAEDADLLGDYMPLVERNILLTEQAVRPDGTASIKLIKPGWGTSGYYSPAVLARDGPKVFHQGLHMHLDHPTRAEEADRKEGSVKDLAGVLTTDATWRPDGPTGPGLYAEAEIFPDYQGPINAMAPHIGVSIRALGDATNGQAEGRKGKIIEAITAAKTTDFVTHAGAGGLILTESARDVPMLWLSEAAENETQEGKDVTEEEAKALTEANATLEAEVARLREALLLREARDVVAEALAKLDMPVPTKARLTEALAKNPPIKDGTLDAEAFQAQIAEAAKAELLYLAEATGKGQIHGMGASSSPGGNGKDALKGSFKEMFVRQGHAPDEAERLAALAAGGR